MFKQTGKLLQSMLLGALLGGLALPVLADSAQEKAASQLSALLSKSETIQGRFSQFTLDASGAQLQESSGTMELKRPGMFRWVTEPPMEQELVSDGQKIWLYDPDLLQVSIQTMDERVTHTPALLLSGNVRQLQDSFSIEQQEQDGIVRFNLKPKAPDTLFDSLRLSFMGERIHDMQLEDAVGQRTNIMFMSLRMNEPLADSHFQFQIPAGVDVIED